jgi:hypothetical protein
LRAWKYERYIALYEKQIPKMEELRKGTRVDASEARQQFSNAMFNWESEGRNEERRWAREKVGLEDS